MSESENENEYMFLKSAGNWIGEYEDKDLSSLDILSKLLNKKQEECEQIISYLYEIADFLYNNDMKIRFTGNKDDFSKFILDLKENMVEIKNEPSIKNAITKLSSVLPLLFIVNKIYIANKLSDLSAILKEYDDNERYIREYKGIVLYPIRCFNCGKILQIERFRMLSLQYRGTDMSELFDALGYTRICCRNNLLTSGNIVGVNYNVGENIVRSHKRPMIIEKDVRDFTESLFETINIENLNEVREERLEKLKSPVVIPKFKTSSKTKKSGSKSKI